MKAKVLIVDDEPNLLRLIGYAIELGGHRPLVAKCGQQALQKARSERPDLIVLDWMLPDISGLDVLTHLRNDPETANVPVIMLSARADVKDRVKGLKAGADEYVSKPVDTSEMVARVEALLRHTRRLQRSHAPPRCLTIAFLGAKGGVGTTTVALNSAALTAQTGKSVAIAEFGWRAGGIAAHLNMRPARTIDDLTDVITPEAVTGCLTKQAPSLHVLFGSFQADRRAPLDPAQVKEILSALKQTSEYVIVDYSASPDLYNEETLHLTDRVFLVLEPEPTSVRAAQDTLQLLQSWGIGKNAVELVLVNRASRAITLNQKEITGKLGDQIAGAIPNTGEALLAAQQAGEPLVTHRPQSNTAAAFSQLVKRITRTEKQSAAPTALARAPTIS